MTNAMNPLPHKFYPIVDDVSWVRRLLPLGVKFIQLRIKERTINEVERQIEEAISIQHEYDATVVINDYWKLAIKYRALYIHLGQEDLDDAEVSKIKDAGIPFGISTHNHKELDYALFHEPDYVAIGPIFTPIAKKMDIAPQGLARISEWKMLVKDIPLVAIGGIRLKDVPDVLKQGADAIACIGDISRNENPEAQVVKWLKAVEDAS